MQNQSQINFQVLFQSVPGKHLILSPDFTIIAVSDNYLMATMTQRTEIVGRNLFDVFPDNPDDPTASGEANLRASLDYVLLHKTVHSMAVQKYDIRAIDGTFQERFWSPINKPVLDTHNNVLYIIHSVEDVTDFIRTKENESRQAKATEELRLLANNQELEIYKRAQEIQQINQQLMAEIVDRKFAEAKISETKALLQSTIESHKDILIFSIDKQYMYLNFNSTFKSSTFHAYGTEVLIGANLFDTITSELDRRKVKQNCDRALSGESHITTEEYGDVNKLYYETRYNPIRNDNDEIIGVTVLSVNVTKRVHAEEQIRELNKDLEAFTYSVAHDLRAPLRIINGYSNILKNDYPQAFDDEAKKLLSMITSNVDRMGKLIDDLLNFSKLGKLSLNRKLVDLYQILNDVCCEQLKLVSPDRVELRIGKIEPANCDHNLMQHVFSNLISNAIKYSSKKEKALIEIGSDRKDDEIIYFVKDNGDGFDMKYADKLFGVFQRLHRSSEFEGTGVGLAIVQRIVTKHGGKIWARAEVNKGATFYFSLQAT